MFDALDSIKKKNEAYLRKGASRRSKLQIPKPSRPLDSHFFTYSFIHCRISS